MASSRKSLRPGAIFDKAYRIERVIGSGAIGRIFLAQELGLQRTVAIKVLRGSVANRLETDARFQREARLLSRLNHPNIVTLYAFGRTRHGEHYIVMEYVEGIDLDTFAAERGPLDTELTLHILRQLASALKHAHNQGIIHRDLKPANILLTRVGDQQHVVKVVDFGLAKASQDATRSTLSGGIAGSPFFMAPEQIEGNPVDGRTDLYALGVLTCFLLTGRIPFHASSAVGYLEAHLSATPTALSQLRPELKLPQGIDDVVLRALEKRPEDRFDSVETFVMALASVLAPSTHWRTRTLTPMSAPTINVDPLLEALGDIPETPFTRNVTVLHLGFYPEVHDDLDPQTYADALALLRDRIGLTLAPFNRIRFGPIADPVILLFGVTEDPYHTTEAIDAALALRQTLEALRQDPMLPEGFVLHFSIALDADRLLILPDLKLTLHSTALSHARRIAAVSRDGEIRITQRLYHEIRDDFQCTDLHTATPTLPAHRKVLLKRRTGVSTQAHRLHGLTVDLIGREQELAMLSNAFARATQNQDIQTLILQGERGVGKSQLVGTFMRRTLDRPEFIRFFAGRCGEKHIPFAPFVEAIRTHARIDDDDPGERLNLKLERYLRHKIAHTAEHLSPREEELFDFLRTLFGLTPESAHLEAQGAPRRLELMLDVVTRLIQTYPTLLLLEDVHRAREETRNLLLALSGLQKTPHGLTLILTQRDDASHPITLPRAHHLTLRRLDTTRTRALVSHLLRRVDPLSNTLVEQLVELSEGLPLLAEEAILALIDRGTLQIHEDRWTLKDASALDTLPKTLDPLFLQRVARLSPRLRAILEATAVAGERAWPSLLMTLTPCNPNDLRELIDRGLLAEQRRSVLAGENSLTFTHDHLRELLYQRLPEARRQPLHAQIADWLEHRLANNPGHETLVAHHARLGGDPERALHFTHRAAQRAARGFLHNEAIAHLENAIATTGELQRPTLDLHLELVQQHIAANHFTEAIELIAKLQPELTPHTAQAAHLAFLEGRALQQLGHPQPALDAWKRTLELTRTLAPRDNALILQTRTAQAELLLEIGESERAALSLLETFAQPHENVGRELLARAHRVLGDAELAAGRPDAAEHSYNQAYQLAITARHPTAIIESLISIGNLHHTRGFPDRARSVWTDALATARERQLPLLQARLLTHLAHLDHAEDAFEDEAQHLERAFELLDRHHAHAELARVGHQLVACLQHLGRDHDAHRYTKILENLAP